MCLTMPTSWIFLLPVYFVLWFLHLLPFLCWHFQRCIPRVLSLTPLSVHSTWMISSLLLVFNSHLHIDTSYILVSVTHSGAQTWVSSSLLVPLVDHIQAPRVSMLHCSRLFLFSPGQLNLVPPRSFLQLLGDHRYTALSLWESFHLGKPNVRQEHKPRTTSQHSGT